MSTLEVLLDLAQRCIHCGEREDAHAVEKKCTVGPDVFEARIKIDKRWSTETQNGYVLPELSPET